MNEEMDPKDELKAENAVEKLKLEMEYGAHFSEFADDLDPGIENEFLRNVRMFEENFTSAPELELYEIIGRPEYKNSEDLSDEDIGTELGKLCDILDKNAIALDSVSPVDDRVLYEFITKELFMHKMMDMRISGMTTYFTYEEFHPNHRYNAEKHALDVVEYFAFSINKREHERNDYMHFTDNLLSVEETRGNRQCPRMNEIVASYTAMALIKNEVTGISIIYGEDPELPVSAQVQLTVAYDLTTEAGEINHFKGEGNITLEHDGDNWWNASYVNLPAILLE